MVRESSTTQCKEPVIRSPDSWRVSIFRPRCSNVPFYQNWTGFRSPSHHGGKPGAPKAEVHSELGWEELGTH